jgi:hypothetical protein
MDGRGAAFVDDSGNASKYLAKYLGSHLQMFIMTFEDVTPKLFFPKLLFGNQALTLFSRTRLRPLILFG